MSVVELERVSKSVIFHTGKPVDNANEKSRSNNISMVLTVREEKVQNDLLKVESGFL